MNKIDVCLSPALLQYANPCKNSSVVVVDILRATSSMVAGIGSGIKHIKPVEDAVICSNFKQKGYVTAGERNGEKIKDFDIGNSPYEFMDKSLHNKKVAMTTTNGTKAINSVYDCEEIIIGAFLNIKAVVKYILFHSKDILVLCAGWKNRFNIEDTLFAGALVDQLHNKYEIASDAALSACELYRSQKEDLQTIMSKASHSKRLSRLSQKKDLEFCFKFNQFNVVPKLDKTSGVIY